MKNRMKQIPTIEQIKALYEAGDIEALRAQNEILAKRANTRLSALEKAGLDDTAAYNRAGKFFDDQGYSSDRFSRSKKMDIDDLYNQIKEESNFLRWQTSTISGETKRRDEIWNALSSQRIDEETGDIKEPVIDLSGVEDVDSFKKSFLDFLDSGAWEDFKKHIYTKHILNDAGEAIAAGASVEDLNEAFRAYKEGTTDNDLFTIWNDWVSVKNK